MKTKRVRVAIQAILAKAAFQAPVVGAVMQTTEQDGYQVEVLTDQILKLAKNQNDY